MIAVLLIAVVVYVNYTSTQEVMKIQVELDIRLEYLNSTGGPTTVRVAFSSNIGFPGGYLATQRYLHDGINGVYPVHSGSASGIIYVDSKVVRSYTLGDFFEVWGQPLGPANTLGYKENFTQSPAPYGQRDYFWDMCIVLPGQSSPIPDFEWGRHALTNMEIVILIYSPLGCA